MNKKNLTLFLSACAILAAFSIIFGKYLALNLSTNFRLSLENLPLLLAGLYLGPGAGAIVGAVADLLGCLLVGYSINPVITLGAMSIGMIAGMVGKAFHHVFSSRRNKSLPLALAIVFSHFIGSVCIKTIGLYLYYGSPLILTAAWRLLIYFCTGIIEFIILYFLTKNQGFMEQMKKIRFKEG